MTALANYLQAGVADRRGAPQIAANHMRAALEQITWDDRMIVYGGGTWKVYLDDALETFTAYVDAENTRVVISTETWDVLACDIDATDQFLADVAAGGTGMFFIVADKDPFRRAVREHARQQGTAVTQAKDAITDVTERANALVVQAASLNQAPTLVQQQVFAVRFAQIGEEVRALEDRMDALRGLLDLAATALYDATV